MYLFKVTLHSQKLKKGVVFEFQKQRRDENPRVRRSGRKERLSDRGVSSNAAFSEFADQRTEKARERRVSLHLRPKLNL